MKKPIVSLALIAVILSAGFLACQKYSSSTATTSDNNNIPKEILVTASVQGRVVDQDGVPVAGATVTSGTASTSTDINGLFSFSNISLSSRFGYVQAAKSGYFTGSRSIATNAGASNFVSIRLITRTEAGSFSATTGGKIIPYSGDTVAFTASSIVNASNNTAYNGTVHVFATYLNPTNEYVSQYMPGDLRGIGKDGKETAIQSFGMMNVELRDDAGNNLQLASGQTATLTFAIPASLQATAPATIPLWYFNDTTGRWIEQGMATRQGNSYVGTVGHFTYWNCDAPFGTVNFKVKVKDQYGNALPHAEVVLTSQNVGDVRTGYTNTDGLASGLLRKGDQLVMKVVTECGDILGGMNVGPALQDVDLGTLTITVTNQDLTISGKVVDCSNILVDSGMVNILVDGLDYRAAVKQGAFSIPVSRCYSTTVPVQLVAADLKTLQFGPLTTVNANSGTLDVGQLSVCSSNNTPTTQFITLTVNNANYSWTNPPNNVFYNTGAGSIGSTPVTWNNFIGNTGNASNEVDLVAHDITGTGQYPATVTMYVPNTNYNYNSSVQLNVTKFGPVNSYISASISGNLKDTLTNITYPVTGSLYILRTQ